MSVINAHLPRAAENGWARVSAASLHPGQMLIRLTWALPYLVRLLCPNPGAQ